jgi:hypothetical protein
LRLRFVKARDGKELDGVLEEDIGLDDGGVDAKGSSADDALAREL